MTNQKSDNPTACGLAAKHPCDQLKNRRILIGITGGIACYKLATVVSTLAQNKVDVTVLMTDAATQFISALTFESLSGNPVYTNMWDRIESHDPQHIALARSADLMLIAPATMNTIAKLAHGLADDIVTLIASAIDLEKTPVLVSPSMNATMLAHPSTQRNIKQLADDGYHIIDPASGWQACRTEGAGRLPEPDDLIDAIVNTLA